MLDSMLDSIKVVKGTYKRYNGMYIGERLNSQIKQNRNILITKIATSFQEIPTGEYYVRNSKYHKKGDPKTKIIHHDFVELYKNILDAWEHASDYPTVSYGLNCTRRDVIVVDVDEEFKDIKSAEEYIYSKCDLEPSYIIQNPTSKHIQFGFVLNTPIRQNQFEYFNALIKRASVIYNSDSCFNGPACKNPFSTLFFDSKISGKIYNVKELIEKWGLLNKKSLFSYFSIHNTNPNLKTRKVGEDKWHNTFLKIGRNLVFKYFRENRQQFPTDEKSIQEISNTTALLTQKSTNIQYVDENEAIYQMISIVNWCNDKGWKRFNDPKSIKGCYYGMKSREKSIETRKNKKLEKIKKFREWMDLYGNKVDLESKGKARKGFMSKKEAAKAIGISYDEFRSYLAEAKKGNVTIKSLFSYFSIHNTNPNLKNNELKNPINQVKNTINQIENPINQVKNTINPINQIEKVA